MTASWGGLGVLWGRRWPPAISVPSGIPGSLWTGRSTLPWRSLTRSTAKPWPCAAARAGVRWIRFRECGFTVKTAECGAPYFEQAQLVLVCRKRYAQPMDSDRMPGDVKEKWYPGQDYHILYLGEIVEAYQR